MAQHHAAQATRMARRLGALEFAKRQTGSNPSFITDHQTTQKLSTREAFPLWSRGYFGKELAGIPNIS